MISFLCSKRKTFGSDCFKPEPTFFKGKIDNRWLPGAGLFSIATYKSQKLG